MRSSNGHNDCMYDSLLRIAKLSTPRKTALPKPRMNFLLRAPIPRTVLEDVVVYMLGCTAADSSEVEGASEDEEWIKSEVEYSCGMGERESG